MMISSCYGQLSAPFPAQSTSIPSPKFQYELANMSFGDLNGYWSVLNGILYHSGKSMMLVSPRMQNKAHKGLYKNKVEELSTNNQNIFQDEQA